MVKKIAQHFMASHVLKGSAAAFALKFAASIAGFTMFALASRSMEPAGFGSLAIIFNAMSFLSVAAICLGMARQALAPTIAWAKERRAFGKAIGEHELITHRIARAAADVYAMEALSELVAGAIDRGRSEFRMEAAVAKLFNSERLWSVVDTAVQVRGGRGYEKAD